MQEQIQMSGLEIMSSSPLQWNSINHWSPILGGGRSGQACVTIVSDNGVHPCESDAAARTIVVLGGATQSEWCSNSVIVWDPSAMEWRRGPNLNDKRKRLVTVVCSDKVYAIGGGGSRGVFDTMESIQVSSLLETMETFTTRQNNGQWTRLQCQLSSPRQACAAVVVQNRYIVILGGDSDRQLLSSVDIMDTAPHHNNNNNNGEPTIVAGPSMNSSRSYFGAAVMDNRIFVVGGFVNEMRSASVESILFQQEPQDMGHENSSSNACCMFPNSSWRVEPHLTLSTGRSSHAMAKVGSCLVVAGGSASRTGLLRNLVEVLDVQRGIVWSLPNLTIERPLGCSMVALSACLLVLGGNNSVDSVESLALTVSRKHERCYKFLKFLTEIEFLGRPNPERKRCI